MPAQYLKENSMTVKVRPIPEGYHALTPYLCSLKRNWQIRLLEVRRYNTSGGTIVLAFRTNPPRTTYR
ncbi:MAG TPA: hypothetical protein VEH53_04350 [archaeon]|nr:hypothetical protein [archaeon]